MSGRPFRGRCGRLAGNDAGHRAHWLRSGREAAMTEAVRSPTAVRRELGQRLGGLREDKQSAVAEAAQGVGFSQSKLTKIGLAQAGATRNGVLPMLDVYEETDPGQ